MQFEFNATVYFFPVNWDPFHVRIIENRVQCYYINFSLYLYKRKIIIMHRDLTKYFTVLNKSKGRIPLQWLQTFHKRFFFFFKQRDMI